MRQPDYRLAIMDKTNSKSGRIGAAWKNDDGSISLVIDPGCEVKYNPDFVITLFPAGYKKKPTPSTATYIPSDNPEDDIPF